MKPFILIASFIILVATNAQTISGKITNKKGEDLAFSSILIKGTTQGTTANAKGKYSLNISKGKYTIVCQYIGYKEAEKTIKVDGNEIVDFVLEEQQYNLTDVVIKNKGEDPAYEIIRQAIAKREEYLNENKKYEVDVYIKGQIQLRNYPKKFFGETVDFEDGDTSKRKMILLSETVAKYYYAGRDEQRTEVISTRVSGQSDAFGFSSPQIISFYQNNVSLGRGLNPRGFVSPIAENALSFYKYKFDGTFFENGKMINRIKVIPRRKYEPLFSGYINIIETEWRIHSCQLKCLKEQQMQFLDTLVLEQLFVPLKNTWVVKQQVVYPAGKFFGFDFFGSFVQVYDKFNVNPKWDKKFFDNTLLKFYDSSNKRSKAYWDSIRPLPLLEAEARDYVKKDSLEQVRKDPKYLDSLDKKNNKITLGKLILTGQNFNKEKTKENVSITPLLSSLLNFNTVEGLVSNVDITYNKRFAGRKNLSINPNIRYGFSNRHLNISSTLSYNFGKKYFNNISVSGGKNIFQFDNNNPISASSNTIATLNWTRNYMKIYEAWFAKANYAAGLGNGLTLNVGFNFQNRQALENTTDYKWKQVEDRSFTPNYPTNLLSANIPYHQSLVTTAQLTWRPGSKYIEFPDRKLQLGSRFPILSASFTQGINNLLGSDVDFSKWKFGVSDNLNLKLGGRISYNAEMGGFLSKRKLFAPDFNHVLSNQTAVATPYLQGFQTMEYYSFSNTDNFFTAGYLEYHLNGLLTNKIPGFKKLNWFLVLGANAIYLNESKRGYYEALIGLENILKVFRVDAVRSFPPQGQGIWCIRFSSPLFRN